MEAVEKKDFVVRNYNIKKLIVKISLKKNQLF